MSFVNKRMLRAVAENRPLDYLASIHLDELERYE